MKKGKTILAAVTLGALTYLAWLGLDIKNPEKSVPRTTPYEVVSETVAQVMPPPPPAPGRVKARKAVQHKKAAPAPRTEEAVVAKALEEKKPKAEIPMPGIWEGTLVKHDRSLKKDECDLDYPCSPRGRDGVLLIGATFALNGWKPIMPEILSVGSYQRRTPLLVYK